MVRKSFPHTSFAILSKELFRSLLKSWKQFISVIAISFLSICLFSGLTSNAEHLSERREDLYSRTNFADIYVTTTGLTSEDWEFISGLDGVYAEKRIYLPIYQGDDIAYLIVADKDASLSIPYITVGENGLLASHSISRDRGWSTRIGLSSSTLTESMPWLVDLMNLIRKPDGFDMFAKNRLSFDSMVTGSMYYPESVQNSDFTPSVWYMTIDYLKSSISANLQANYNMSALDGIMSLLGMQTVSERISSFIDSSFNQIILNADDPDKTMVAIKNYFSAKQSSNLVSASFKEELNCYSELNQEVNQSKALTYVFPLIFFLVSVLVILTTLSQMIVKQRSQIGAMKAIGVSRKQIYIHYTCYGMVLCFVGALIGFFVGPSFIPDVLGVKYSLLWVLPETPVHYFYPISFLLALALVVFAGVCSLLVSWSVIREKPADTLRPKETKSRKKAVKDGSFYQKHAPLELKMAFRNIAKNPGKSLMVVFGTLGCTALLVCGFGIMDTIFYGINLDLFQNQHFDLMITTAKADDSLENMILELPETRKVEECATYPVTVTGKASMDDKLTILDPGTEYMDINLQPDSVSIDALTSEKLGVEVGDTVTLTIDSQTYTRKVSAVFKSSFLNGIYELKSDYPAGKFSPNQYIVFLKDSADREEVKQILSTDPRVLNIQTPDSVYDSALDITSTISVMTTVIEIFAVLLSIVVIYNLISLNITERTRDIATMKVLGFRYSEIAKTLTFEIMSDVIVGTIIGLLCGFPLMQLVLYVNRTELLTFIYHIDWDTYLISFAISVAVSLGVSLLLCLKAKRINMSESLKSVE